MKRYKQTLTKFSNQNLEAQIKSRWKQKIRKEKKSTKTKTTFLWNRWHVVVLQERSKKLTFIGNWYSSIHKAESKGEAFFCSIPVIISIKIYDSEAKVGRSCTPNMVIYKQTERARQTRYSKWVSWKELYVPLLFGRNLACKSSCLYSSISRCSFRSSSQNLTNELLALTL